MLLVTDALAQAGGATAPGAVNPTTAMIVRMFPILLLIVIFYLILIRPQQMQAKKTKDMQSGLKKGDRVVTTGGMMGTIVGLDEQKAVLRVADDVKVEFLRSAIVSVLPEGR